MLKMIGPVTSFLGSVVGLATALRSSDSKRDAAVFSSLLGLIGSTAWLVAAYQDHLEERSELEVAWQPAEHI